MNKDNTPRRYDDNSILHTGLLLLLLCIMIAWAMATPILSGETTDSEGSDFDDKNVLYISSYSPSFRTFFQQVEGIRKVFNGYPITLDVEFMDTKRFFTEENILNFQTSMEYKLNFVEYDAVIVGDDNGINFIMEKKDEWFPDTPVFFLGVNNYDKALAYSSVDDVTGVFEAPSFGDTIQMAYDLNPEAKAVVALVDATASGQGDLELFYKEKDRFKDLDFQALDLSEMTFNEFTDKLEDLGHDDLLLLVSVYRDYTGQTLSFEEGVDLVLSATDQPVYHPYEHGVGEGLLGGRVVSHVEQGCAAGKMVIDYFQGKPISLMPLIDQSPNEYMVDYEVLSKHGLDRDQLPQDTILINYEPGFIEENLALVLWVSLIIVAELLIILALIYLVIARRKAQEALLESQLELKDSYDEVEAMNEELKTTIDDLKVTNEKLENSVIEVEIRDERINELVYLDSLTGLLNRFSIYEEIERLLYDSETKQLVILFLDVDNFKNINDIFGHDVGDQVIRDTGKKLKDLQDEDIYIGRFGGDEFIFAIAKPWTMNEIEFFAKEVQDLFKGIIHLEDHGFILSVSLGISIYPDHGDTKELLIKKADIALYDAKNRGKDQFVVFDKQLDDELAERVSFQNLLADGFKNNEFMVYYQPVYMAGSHGIKGYEALIRWYSKELGWVSPYKMITVAEEVGSIIEIGEFVIRRAVDFSARINKNSKRDICVSINISMVQLMFTGFADLIKKIVDEAHVSSNCICLEMTETVFIKNIIEGREVINQLRKYGFKISLDDFGTGYSSLGYLKELDIQVLKIDQSFIRFMEKGSYDRFMVKSIIELAKQKGVEVVAEGVETLEQLEMLEEMSCDMIQGYYFNKPMPEKEAMALLEKEE